MFLKIELMFLKLKLKGSELKIEAPKNKNYGRPVHGPPLWTSSMDPRSWTRFMDHPCGPGPWILARGPGAWNTSVDHPKCLKMNFASGVNEFKKR